MRIVLTILILLFSSSSFAISLEDGLRIKLNSSIENKLKVPPNEITIEFIQLYLETLKYKELLTLSSAKAKENKINLTQAKMQAEIDSSKNSKLKKITKIYFAGNSRKILDQINYTKAKEKLQNTLHVKVFDVKLPLIQQVPKSLDKAIQLALESRGLNQKRDKNSLFQEKIDLTIKEIKHQWYKFEDAQKNYTKTKVTQREKINTNYNYRVATYNLLATNYTFLDDVLSKAIPFKNENLFVEKSDNNVMMLHFQEKIKNKPIKKNKQIRKVRKIPKSTININQDKIVLCFKVDTDILNVREKHSQKSKIVHRYVKNDIICASKQTFSWIKTKHGWCSKDYLIRVKSEL